MNNMQKYRFFALLIISISVFAGCRASADSHAASENIVVIASPTPPGNSQVEPPPEPPTTPLPKASLEMNASASDAELINAVDAENAPEVKRLLVSGANPNAFVKDSNYQTLNYYETVLGKAVDKKNTEIAGLLLEYGADANKHSFDAYQPPVLSKTNFMTAVSNEDIAMLKLLTGHQAELKVNADAPPIITNVKNTDVLDFLVNHGFDINAQDAEGRNILANAIFDKNTNLVKVILKYKPDLNQKIGPTRFTDFKKITPLRLAATYGNQEIVRELKKAGAKK